MLLLYVTLDLSVPVVGGAFVFEASERIDTLQVSRTRPVGVCVVTPRLPDVSAAPELRVRGLGTRAGLPAELPVGERLVVHHRPRAALALASAAPSDDH